MGVDLSWDGGHGTLVGRGTSTREADRPDVDVDIPRRSMAATGPRRSAAERRGAEGGRRDDPTIRFVIEDDVVVDSVAVR